MIDGQFAGEACDYGWYGFGEHEQPQEEEDMAVVGFGKFNNGGSRRRNYSTGYGGSGHYPTYGETYRQNSWGWNRDKAELPTALFINNYFNLHFTCGTCAKQYSTFSARPDVELTCAHCGGEGVTTPEEVFTEFVLPKNATKCGNCNLALLTEGDTQYLICPKCGKRMSDAKLAKGSTKVSAK